MQEAQQRIATMLTGESFPDGAQNNRVQWSLNPQGGPLQGPLDLGFFTGQTLCLDLSPKQVALVAGEGRLSRLFLGGHHILPVGTGIHLLSPNQRLIFLDLEQPFQFSFTRSDRVVWGQRARRSLLGACSVNIHSPEAFFASFLAGNEALDPGFVYRLLGQVIRSSLAETLTQILPEADDWGFQKVQDCVLKLKPTILRAHCDPFGLVCTDLSLYIAPPPTHSITDGETAGQSYAIRHN